MNLGWVCQLMGNAFGLAMGPLWDLRMWPKVTAIGAVAAAWAGMVLALAVWLMVCAVVWSVRVVLVAP